MPANDSQTKTLCGGRTVWIPRNADSYGKEIVLLGEHVVDHLAYVVCGDFQNTIIEAIMLEQKGEDVGIYLKRMLFKFTPPMTMAERIEILKTASDEARRRITLGDAEARLLRPLIDSDLQPKNLSGPQTEQ